MNVRRIIWKGKNQPNFLVISTKEYAAEMVKQFSSRMYNGFNLSGLAIMDEKLDDTVIERIPVVCSKDNLLEYVQKNTNRLLHLVKQLGQVVGFIRHARGGEGYVVGQIPLAD